MTISTNATTQLDYHSRAEERAILAVTCLAAFLFFNSFGSIGVALPAIQKQFGNSLAEIQWVVLMGVVTISSLSFCFGRAGGIFGQRRLYKLGVAFYATGAAFGALSNSFAQLLGARAVMAIGLAMALPMSTAILAGSFDAAKRGQALGVFASAVAIGRMTGPTVGGFLLQLGGWPWIFWMNAIVGFVVTAAVALIFKGPGEQCREPFDFYGSAALLIGYPALLVALTFGAKTAWTSPEVLLAFGVGVIGIASFIRIELHTAKPLVDLSLFRQRALTGALISAVLCQLIYSPITLCAPLYLQNVLGASAMTAGFLLAILPLSTAIFSPLSGSFADRFEPSKVSGFGVIAIAVAIGFYAGLDETASFTAAAMALALLGAGIGVFTPANQKVAFASVAQQDYGLLAAMLSSFGTAAGTVGTTITVALMESDGGSNLWTTPATLAHAQQFAFACLLPLGLLAIVIAFRVRATRLASSKCF